MKISDLETESLLKGELIFEQLGFSMLLTRLKKLYIQDTSPSTLEKCSVEINAFLEKFKSIMIADIENISKSFSSSTSRIVTFEEVSELIGEGKLLHIAGSEDLLRKLPKGNWVGGSTEYFMAEDGGIVSGEALVATEFSYNEFSIKSYGADEIANVANDAYENGFSIVIVPFDSEVHTVYAENAADYENIFMRNIIGWISGMNLNAPDQTPIAVDGLKSEVHTDKAVALHLKVPTEKNVCIKIINIFSQDEKSPEIEFAEQGFSVRNCYVDGKETPLADYIEQNGIDVKLPIVGNYSGNGVNISIKSIENGVVNFYAPVFSGIKYRVSKEVPDYAAAFQNHLSNINGKDTVFSCNCILNFLYGELEGKEIRQFTGPVTFGEIAYQLLNQTLVYVTVSN